MQEYAKAFQFNGNNKGCLVIHGFTGSPAHMRLLGEALHKEGYTVKGALLKGHGTTLEDMEQTSWQEWLESAVEAYKELYEACDEVYVIGLSLGGILALALAADYPVDKVVTMAAPIKIYSKLAHLTTILKYFRRYNKISPRSNKKISNRKEADSYQAYRIGYPKAPLASISDLLKIIKFTTKKLSSVTCPTLVIQSYEDEVVKPISGQLIYDEIESTHKELIWLEGSHHLCTLGPEKDEIHQAIIEFLKK